MKRLPIVLLALNGLIAAQSLRDVAADTWAATDALGRVLPDHVACGGPRTRAVGIFYFTWHGAHGYDRHRQPPEPHQGVWPKEARPYRGPYDISKILAANPATPQWGPVHAFHHWGEPWLGYYLSDDEAVIRIHARMLVAAGVDVMILDVTNALTYTQTYMTIFRVLQDLRARGIPTPRIAFLANAQAKRVTRRLWDELYSKKLFSSLWYRWKGKPLLLAPPSDVDPDLRDFFTIRRSWAWSATSWFGDGEDRWPWLDHHPQAWGWHEDAKKPEQMPVAAAQHPTTNIGRSFQGGRQPGPEGLKTREGPCFEEQWRRALSVDPEFVLVTGWNEWTAMRFLSDGTQSLAGRRLKEGETFFVDAYTQEFSRDIEPMRGGHGDDYYYQLVANVRRYKGVRPVEKASAPVDLRLRERSPSWAEVRPVYLDHEGDAAARSHPGWGRAGPYRNRSGRNDLVSAQVVRDGEDVAFRVTTAAALSDEAADRSDWMILYVDVDRSRKSGWEGYDLVVGRGGYAGGRVAVDRLQPGRGRTRVARAGYRRGPQELVVVLPRSLLCRADGSFDFEFKWVDRGGISGSILRWIDHGDAAPDGRFNYVYRANP